MSNDTKKCPYCGEDIRINAKKCKHCGEWLIKSEENNLDNVQSVKHCPFCGNIIPKNAQRCSICREWLVREGDNNYEKGDGYIVSVFIWTLGFFSILGILGFCEDSESCIGLSAIVVAVGIFLEIYFLPTRIALNKKHTYTFIVFLINTFLGETLIGWIIALIIASVQRKGRNSLL